jgi:hypothetical protein
MPNNQPGSPNKEILARGGGNATAAGVAFQASIGAVFAAQLVAERIIDARMGLGNARIASLRFETEAPVDDLLIETDQGGYVFIQAKTKLTLSNQAGSEIGKVADQFVRLWLSCARGTGSRGWDRPLRRNVDLALLVVGRDSSAAILKNLSRALTAIQAAGAAPLAEGPLNALDRFSSLVERAWTKVEGRPPNRDDITALLKQIMILPFDPEGPDRVSAQETLMAVLESANDAGAAFAVLAEKCKDLMKGRLGAAASGFRRALLSANIRVLAPPSFAADVARLRSYSQGVEQQLNQYEETLVGSQEVHIERACVGAVASAAAEDSLLLIGEPGAGKSAVVSSAARQLRQQGREVVELAVDRLPVESLDGLSRELGLSHPVSSVLSNWPGDGPAFLFIDALDATRGGRSEAVFRSLIEQVLALPDARWRVVASIRTFDLRLGHQFRELFAGAAPNQSFLDRAFADVRHIQVPPWSESELSDFLNRAPGIAAAITAGGWRLRELAQVPFNTKLLADLINAGVEPHAFGHLNSQVELLALYWNRRVAAFGTPAELALQAVVDEMVRSRALQARKLDVARTNSAALDRLLGINLLVLRGHDEQFVAFRHHILFDYAASRLYIRLDNLDEMATLLERNRGLGLMLAPALAFALRGLWFESGVGRQQFWNAVVCFAGDILCDPIARSVCARTAAELPQHPTDVLGLIKALPNPGQQDRATRAFGHVVGALAVRADDKEKIATAPWCELAERAISHVAKLLWPLRTLTFLLVELTKSEAERGQVGLAARALLAFGLDHANTQQQLIAASIDFVADTYSSDITASRDLLRRLFEPAHFEAHADQELPWLARKVSPISAVDPDFVVDIYTAIFGGQIDDTSKTSIGQSAILPLSSNRRQDYDMTRFSLKEYFPEFLERWPIHALTALQRAMTGYIDLEHAAGSGEPELWTISTDHGKVRLRQDLSHIWAWNPDDPHADNTLALLKAFVDRLRSAEPELARTMVEHIIHDNDLAVIWTRTFLVAAERPDVLGPMLWPLAVRGPFLECVDTIKDAVDFIAARYPSEPVSDRERFERMVFGRDFSWSGDPENARRAFFRRVFGRIGSAQLVTSEARAFIEAEQGAPGRAEENRRPYGITSEWIDADARDPYWWLSQAGVDAREPQNAALLRETDEIKTALGIEPQADISIDVPAAVASLCQFYQHIRSASVDPRIDEHATGMLGRGVAKVLARPAEQLRASGDAVRDLVPLIEFLAISPFPTPRADAEEKFERMASWAPSPRIEAGEAIMRLIHLDASYAASFRTTVEALLSDPEPAVRLQIVDRLTMLWTAAPAWMWELADRVARRETNRGVLKFFVNYFLMRVVHHATDQVENLTFVISERDFALTEKPTEEVLQQLGSIIAIMWISHGRERARQTLQAWLADAPAYERELSHGVHASREALVLKYIKDDPRDEEITRRAQEFAAWVVEATATGIEAFLATTKPSQSDQNRVGTFAKLLNNVTNQFYFASGAFQERQSKAPALATTEAKAGFLQDNYTTLRRIADAGTPPTIFHLIELFEFLIPADPPRVFDLVAHALLGAGKRHGFQFESLGADRFVGLIGEFLADYRSLFTDDDRRDKLIACLDAFLEAGWPAARRLLYRLPELLQ